MKKSSVKFFLYPLLFGICYAIYTYNASNYSYELPIASYNQDIKSYSSQLNPSSTQTGNTGERELSYGIANSTKVGVPEVSGNKPFFQETIGNEAFDLSHSDQDIDHRADEGNYLDISLSTLNNAGEPNSLPGNVYAFNLATPSLKKREGTNTKSSQNQIARFTPVMEQNLGGGGFLPPDAEVPLDNGDILILLGGILIGMWKLTTKKLLLELVGKLKLAGRAN